MWFSFGTVSLYRVVVVTVRSVAQRNLLEFVINVISDSIEM